MTMFTVEEQKEMNDAMQAALSKAVCRKATVLEEGMKFTSANIQVINIQPSDRLVVFTDEPISQKAAANIRKRVKEWAGTEHEVIVFENGLRLGVLKQGESDSPTMTIHNPHPRSV